MEQFIILYTMKGCPFCVILKEQLQKNKIDFVERDIDDEKEEYDLFVEAVNGNEYVPAFMIIETDGQNHKTKLFAPERDFEGIQDGLEIIKEHYNSFKNI